jgi:methylamine dehydrogenase accessory protein MauD
MSPFLIGSYVAIWIIVALLTVAMAALARQIGLLHQRLPQTGARMGNIGPNLGDTAKPFVAQDLNGQTVYIPDPEKPYTLLVFVSDGCASCEQLAPAIIATAKQEQKHLKLVVIAFNGDEASNRAYAKKRGLSHLPFISSSESAVHFQVFTTPYAVLLDPKGVVITKGLVNRREHLDSIVNAAETGYASIQAMIAGKTINGNNGASREGQSLPESSIGKG